jgi:branched-subunit amino acid ABC-type transport system permease component
LTVAYSFSDYVLQIILGLGNGAILFLVASGLSLIFGALRVINFAHGSLYMLGAYIAVSLAGPIGFGAATFWIVMLLAGLAIAAAGTLLEVTVFRLIYNRDLLWQLLATFAFVLIIAAVVREVWGNQGESTPTPGFLSGGVKVLDGQIPRFNFFFIALAVAVAILLWAIMYKTNLGRMIRAAVSDPTLLRLSGVNVRLLFTGVFALASFFAGLAGGAILIQGFFGPDLGIDAIIRAFVIVVIGGMGSLAGAFVASFLVGVAEALGILWVPEASIAIVFAVLVIVLATRPQGLLGSRTV